MLQAKEKAAKAKAEREQQAKHEKDGIVDRKDFARRLETPYLDNGFNMDASTQCPKSDVLRMKYALTSKVLAHQISNSDVLLKCRQMGFRKVFLPNGFDDSSLSETYYWNLDKKQPLLGHVFKVRMVMNNQVVLFVEKL